MRRSDGWRHLHLRAQQQAGLVTPGDAREFGIPESTYSRRCRDEEWPCHGGGVRRLPGAPVTELTTHHAALLSLGPSSAISHGTAAGLHGLVTLEPDGLVHAVIPHDMDPQPARGVIRHRSRQLDSIDVTMVRGLRITTPERTLLDIAASMTTWKLEAIVLQMRQRGQLDSEAVREQLDRRPTLKGAGRVRAAMETLQVDGSDSILERRVRTLLVEAGLSPTTTPHPVRCGHRNLMVDLAFPVQRVAVECDGFAYHSAPAAFERDRQRWSLLRQAGWTVIWVTWRRLHERPNDVVAEVGRAVRSRS